MNETTTRLKIKEMAGLAGVGVETVRFYEREGLLAEPERTPAGYRLYPGEAVQRVRFIKRAQTLGFTLSEIRELLDIQARDDSTRADVRERALVKIGDIERKIATLQAMRETLQEITRACDGQGSLTGCPILQALEDDDLRRETTL